MPAKRTTDLTTKAGAQSKPARNLAGALAKRILTKEDLNQFASAKSGLWRVKAHETSTRTIPKAPKEFFRGMRVTATEVLNFAKNGLGDKNSPYSPKIDATDSPADAWSFSLGGGFNARTKQDNGPKGDYVSVIFRVSGVGSELPFTWTFHGPAYSTQRLVITKHIDPKQITGLWIFNKKSQLFEDHSALWKEARGDSTQ